RRGAMRCGCIEDSHGGIFDQCNGFPRGVVWKTKDSDLGFVERARTGADILAVGVRQQTNGDVVPVREPPADFQSGRSGSAVDFDGRTGRAQFWYYIAVYVVVGILVSIVGSIALTGGGLRALYGLALLLPTLGITARRLHDMGRTASWVLLLAVPWGLSIIMGL